MSNHNALKIAAIGHSFNSAQQEIGKKFFTSLPADPTRHSPQVTAP